MKNLLLTASVLLGLGVTQPALAYRIFVSNEKDNTVTVLDGASLEIVKTVPVGARPRGMVLSADGKTIFICTSDADHIEALDLATLTVAYTLPSNHDPEFLALTHDGKILYVANEDNSQVSVLDISQRKILSEIQVGVEPEGMAVSPDDKTVLCTSETTSMAHFIDVAAVCGFLPGWQQGLGIIGGGGHCGGDRHRDAQGANDHPFRFARGAEGGDSGGGD
jgi:YVTN family beta-propeller protein